MVEEDKIRVLEFENQLLRTQLRTTSDRFEEKIFELSVVKEVALSLLSTSDFRQTCKNILDVIIKNSIAQNCSIMLVDQDANQLFLVAASACDSEAYVVDARQIFSKEEILYFFKVGEGAAGKAVLAKEPVLVADVNQSHDYAFDANTRVSIGSLLSLPLVIEDIAMGVVNLSHARKNIFTAEQINLFSILVNYIALSIHTVLGHEKLKYSEHKYRTLTESTYDGIAILQNGMHLYTNPAYQKITGYTHEELEAIPFEMLLDHSNADINHENVVFLLNGRVPNYHPEIRILDSQQRKIELEINSSPITHDGREAVLISARDLTVRRQLELQLRHVQKMEAIGTLAGGIAHDFNNILAAIIGFTEMALNKASDSKPMRHYLEQVLKAGHRAKDLVNHILAFSRQTQIEKRTPIEIASVIEEAIKLLRASLPTTIEIRQNIGTKIGVALADPTEVHQVVVNLCTNAAHAMEERGGVLEISLGEATIDSDADGGFADLKPGHHLRLTVSDTGHGIDPANLDRIFDPYFTTKEVGKGSGLGLAVVHGIVKRHEGAITVNSELGVGTSFHVYFPKYFPKVESMAAKEVDQVEQPLPKGTERVLFVDDEESLVEMGKGVLECLGYEVTVTTNSVEALELFRAHSDHFDAVITDYTMPQMTGADFAKEMMRIRPDIPVILCTGFSEKISEKKARDMGISAFLMKPFNMRDIAETVRRVLDEK